MRTIILTFLCCFLSLQVSAQKTAENMRMISLTDGSVIMGTIIDDNNAYMLVEIVGGEQVKIFHKYIRKTSKTRPNRYFLDNGKAFKNKGIFFTLEMGNSFGFGGVGSHFRSIIGKYYKHNWAFGLGIMGVDVHATWDGAPYPLMPIYAHARYYPYDFKVSPYAAFNIGYGIPLATQQGTIRGGIMVNPTLGLRFASRLKSNFFLEMGLIIQDAYGDYIRWRDGAHVIEDVTFRRTKFTFGWIF